MKFFRCHTLIARYGLTVLTTVMLSMTSTYALATPQASTNALTQRLMEDVEQYLVEAMGSQFDGEPIIHVVQPTTIQAVAHCTAFHIYLPPGRKLRTSTTVAVRCQHEESNPIYVRATVEVQGTYYVTSQSIGANQTIEDTMLEARTGDLLRMQTHALASPEQLVGRVTTQRILAGQPIRLSATQSAQAIQRGDTVQVEAHGPGLYISNQGEALITADVGSPIDVRMPNAKVVRGIVRGSGVVFVTF